MYSYSTFLIMVPQTWKSHHFYWYVPNNHHSLQKCWTTLSIDIPPYMTIPPFLYFFRILGFWQCYFDNIAQMKYRINTKINQWDNVISATDSCRDGSNVRNSSSRHVQVFRDQWNVQIGNGWNVRNCLNMNFLKLVEIWIWILQNLRCPSSKSTNFGLVVKPTLMSLFWLFGLCLFGLLFAMYDS